MKRQEEAEEALEWAEALGGSEAKRALRRLRAAQQGDWWAWWFSSISPWPRRVAGVCLLALLALYLAFPLLSPGDTYIPIPRGGRYYLNAGQTWEHYAVPTAAILVLLLIPSIVKLKVFGVEIEPRPPQPQAMLELKPRLTT